MYDLTKYFRPITANPIRKTYSETPPCDILKPYIRCFWKSQHSFSQVESQDILVIPDTCMDIIFELDYETHQVSSSFCGISGSSFYSPTNSSIEHFGIRFYFWSVHLFTDIALRSVFDSFTPLENYFERINKQITHLITPESSFSEKISCVEKALIERLLVSNKTNHNVLNAIFSILNSKGTESIQHIASSLALSSRSIERNFLDYIGVTPKKLAELVRFQNIWQEIFFLHRLDYSELVYKYKFTDQPHLINRFKKISGKTPLELLKISTLSHFYNTSILD